MTNNPIKNEEEQQKTKKDTLQKKICQLVNKHMKNCPTALVSRENAN